MFDAKSRYIKAEKLVVTDARGRMVNAIVPPPPPEKSLLGIHALRQGERIDLLAAKYTDDAAGYWRIAEQNNVMLPETLTEQREIEIPTKGK